MITHSPKYLIGIAVGWDSRYTVGVDSDSAEDTLPRKLDVLTYAFNC